MSGSTVSSMQKARSRYRLRWSPEGLRNALSGIGVTTRSEFVRWSGWPTSTTYDMFNDDFSGFASDEKLAEISVRTGVPISVLAYPVSRHGSNKSERLDVTSKIPNVPNAKTARRA